MAYDPILQECTPAQVNQPLRSGLVLFRDITDGIFKAKDYTGAIIVVGGGGGITGWQLDGNTNPALRYIGTNNAFDFPIRTNNVEVARFTTAGDLKLFGNILDSAGLLTIEPTGRILRTIAGVEVVNWNTNLLLAPTGAVNVSINQPVPLYLFHIKATFASFPCEYIESPNGLGAVSLGFSGNGGIIQLKDSTGATTAQFDSAGSSFITGGNVGIGTSLPNISALLELSSTTGALLVTRMTSLQEGALTAINGMIIYNTDTNKFRAYENGAWVNMI